MKFLSSVASGVLLFLVGCISAEKARQIDHGFLNQPHAELKKELHTSTTPFTGLRTSSAGSNACTACASK